MNRVIFLASIFLVVTGCDDGSRPEPVAEMNSKKAPSRPMTMNKKNTGIYNGHVVSKFASDGFHLRLSMGDFKLVISDEVAKGRDMADFAEKMISVKGKTEGTNFIVSEWLD